MTDNAGRSLAHHRWEIDDFTLVRSTSIPDLDDPCGRYLTFRQLIECGETQARTGLPNHPKERVTNKVNSSTFGDAFGPHSGPYASPGSL